MAIPLQSIPSQTPHTQLHNSAYENSAWYKQFPPDSVRLGNVTPGTEQFPLQVWQWSKRNAEGSYRVLDSPEALKWCDPCDLEIICAPHDIRRAQDFQPLLELLEYFNVPSNFLCERIVSAPHSFGIKQRHNGSDYSWCHLLFKMINIEPTASAVQADAGATTRKWALKSNHSDWYRAGYVMIQEPQGGSTRGGRCVTLLCFMATQFLEQRFESLLKAPDWEDILADPFLLYDMVFEDYLILLQGNIKTLAEVYNDIEKYTNRRATDIESASSIDFGELHNVARNIIYMREAVDAAVCVVEEACAVHKIKPTGGPVHWARTQAQNSLRYRLQMFKSLLGKVNSEEKRMSNTIALCFNLVTQYDSRVMRHDSKIVKAIAVVTLIFLPATAVATIFGMEFFSLDTDDGFREQRFQVHPLIWLFWAITGGVTCLVGCFMVALLYRQLPRGISMTLAKGRGLFGSGAR